jgi:hypothetical protein
MNAILSTTSKRTEVVAALNTLIALLPSLPEVTLVINGAKVTLADIAAEAKSLLAAMNATDVARKQLHDATVAEMQLRASMKAKATSLRSYIVGLLGASSTQAAALGFEPKPRSTPTVAVKAEAIEKRALTREARHTMGKKQKAAIHGTPTVAAPTATPAAPAPATPVAPATTGNK